MNKGSLFYRFTHVLCMQVEFHLKQLERQILPTDTTKMSLWTLDQDDSFYEDKKRGSLSVILRKELGLSLIHI